MRSAASAAVLAAVLLTSAPAAVLAASAPASAGPAAAAPAAATGDGVDRRITDDRITENSGLAASLRSPGVLWTLNDSGNPPQIFAVGTDGKTDATVRLAGETNRDWEAITSFRLGGTPYLAVGDIGDNNAVHPTIRIAILPEPALRSGTVTPQRVVRLRYPDGPRDAETLVADPRTGRLHVVSKSLLSAEIYAVPESVWPGRRTGTTGPTTLERVAATSASLITDGTFLPDGRLALRGYGTLYLLPGPASARGGRLRPLATAALPSQEQGESITTGPGGTLLIGSEGENQPVLRIPVPATGSDGTEIDEDPAPTSLPTDPYGVTPAPEPTGTATDEDGDRDGFPLLALGTAVVAVVAIGGAAAALRRR